MNKETSMALIANAIAIIVAIQSLINTSITSLTIIFLVIGIFVSLFIIFSKKILTYSKIIKYTVIMTTLILITLLFIVTRSFIASSINNSWEKPKVQFFLKEDENNSKLLIAEEIVKKGNNIFIEITAKNDSYVMVLITDSLGKSARLRVKNKMGLKSGSRYIEAHKVIYLPSSKKSWILDDSKGLETFHVISSLGKISDKEIDSLLKRMNGANNRAILGIQEHKTNMYMLSQMIRGEIVHYFKKNDAVDIFSITLKHQ